MKIVALGLLVLGAVCFGISRLSKKIVREESEKAYGKVKVLSTAGSTLFEGGILLLALV